jgi:hypothetical protein
VCYLDEGDEELQLRDECARAQSENSAAQQLACCYQHRVEASKGPTSVEAGNKLVRQHHVGIHEAYEQDGRYRNRKRYEIFPRRLANVWAGSALKSPLVEEQAGVARPAEGTRALPRAEAFERAVCSKATEGGIAEAASSACGGCPVHEVIAAGSDHAVPPFLPRAKFEANGSRQCTTPMEFGRILADSPPPRREYHRRQSGVQTFATRNVCRRTPPARRRRHRVGHAKEVLRAYVTGQ